MTYQALAAYIEDRDFPLIGALQVAPELTASEATMQVGLKGSSNLHFMSTDVVFQDGDNCSRTASGATAFHRQNYHSCAYRSIRGFMSF